MISTLLFIGFSSILLGSALMVIIAQHPVRSALSLVLCFFAATGLWLLLSAEFLALMLILVYVGAVMTLFLFVVMTINVDFSTLKQSFLRYFLPIGLLSAALLTVLLIYVLGATHVTFSSTMPANPQPNVNQLGEVLYTQYALPFEISAVILLVAMVSAISLTLFEPIRRKQQSVSEQVNVKPSERIKLVKQLK